MGMGWPSGLCAVLVVGMVGDHATDWVPPRRPSHCSACLGSCAQVYLWQCFLLLGGYMCYMCLTIYLSR